jgi:hypothetical protein
MPAISTKLVLQSAAQAANVALADIDLIKGALYGVATATDLDSIHPNYLSDGQLMFVQDEAKFYSLTITLGNPFEGTSDSYDWDEVTLGASGAITSDDTGSFVLNSQTGSFLTSEDTGSFILVSETSSMSVATASYVDPIFISASAAASGFGQGGDTLPDGTISGSQQITDFGFISSSVDISALNAFSGSIQDQVDALIAATGSYLDDTNTILVTQSEPTATAGGLYFDGSDFYVGL